MVCLEKKEGFADKFRYFSSFEIESKDENKRIFFYNEEDDIELVLGPYYELQKFISNDKKRASECHFWTIENKKHIHYVICFDKDELI